MGFGSRDSSKFGPRDSNGRSRPLDRGRPVPPPLRTLGVLLETARDCARASESRALSTTFRLRSVHVRTAPSERTEGSTPAGWAISLVGRDLKTSDQARGHAIGSLKKSIVLTVAFAHNHPPTFPINMRGSNHTSPIPTRLARFLLSARSVMPLVNPWPPARISPVRWAKPFHMNSWSCGLNDSDHNWGEG